MFTTEETNSLINKAKQKAVVLFSAEKYQESKEILDQLIKVDPDNAGALQLLGLVLFRTGKFDLAIDCFSKASEKDSSTLVDNLNNTALVYSAKGDFKESLRLMKRVVDILPSANHWNNLGIQYRQVNEYREAIDCFEESLRLKKDANVWANIGGVYGELQNLEKAENAFLEAIKLNPDHAHANVDLAYVYFLKGNWEKAWEKYEYRRSYLHQAAIWNEIYPIEKAWDGSSLEGKTLLLYCEQGCGDAIHFARYIPLLPACKILIHCPEELHSLMSRFGKPFDMKIACKPPEHDFNLSLMSLPFKLKTSLIPKSPYIFIDKKGDFSNYKTFNVGICWAGNPQHPCDKQRSCHLKYFKFLNLPGIKLFSLQKDLRARMYKFDEKITDLMENNEDINLVDLSEFMTNFEETAALIKGLDLVISVDTSILHLAGSIGKEAWGLLAYNPDWRWKLDGNSTEWYENMRLFRQKVSGDWDGVFEEVRREIINKAQEISLGLCL